MHIVCGGAAQWQSLCGTNVKWLLPSLALFTEHYGLIMYYPWLRHYAFSFIATVGESNTEETSSAESVIVQAVDRYINLLIVSVIL